MPPVFPRGVEAVVDIFLGAFLGSSVDTTLHRPQGRGSQTFLSAKQCKIFTWSTPCFYIVK